MTEGGLSGGEARHGDTTWRATHVVHADFVAERHRGRVAALLAADPHLERRALFAAAFDTDAHQFPNPFAVDRLEGVVRQDLLFEVFAQELALRVISRVAV